MDDFGYQRGWERYRFDPLNVRHSPIHNGDVDVDTSFAFERGPGKPFVAFVTVPPSQSPATAIGMHIHRNETSGKEVDEWYFIIDGTGIQRFTNGDSIEFGPGDLIVVYPGTGHSLEVTSDKPVKLLVISPEFHRDRSVGVDRPAWPETWQPRISRS